MAAAKPTDRLVITEYQSIRSGGPDWHLHLKTVEYRAECISVFEEETVLQIGEQRLSRNAAESMLAPPRVPHIFYAIGEFPGRIMIALSPAGRMGENFRGVEASDHPKKGNQVLRGRVDQARSLFGSSP